MLRAIPQTSPAFGESKLAGASAPLFSRDTEMEKTFRHCLSQPVTRLTTKNWLSLAKTFPQGCELKQVLALWVPGFSLPRRPLPTLVPVATTWKTWLPTYLCQIEPKSHWILQAVGSKNVSRCAEKFNPVLYRVKSERAGPVTTTQLCNWR